MLSDRCACFSEEINFMEIHFREDLFLLCKFWHISHRFIFTGGEILIILSGRIFTVIKHVLIIP